MFFVFLGFALADLFFLLTWMVLGYAVDSDPDRAQNHQLGGLLVCILTCFTHSLTFVYFLGTGLAVKDAVKNWGISRNYVKHTRGYKLKAYPIAMIAIAFTIASGILGGAVRSQSVASWVHACFACAALLLTAAAFAVALRLILRNGYMLGLIRGDIQDIRRSAEAGQTPKVVESAALPIMLRKPEDVKLAPRGFLWARALLFLTVSLWLFYAYLEWFYKAPNVSWVPFAVLSMILLPMSVFFRIRHPLPADVDF